MYLPYMLIAAVVGGGTGWIGNYFVQSSIHLHHRSVDDLKRRLYDFMEMSSVYWINGDKGGTAERHALEARIIANQQIIMTEYSLLKKKQKRMKKSYQETKDLRMILWDSATGGCFQQQTWKPDDSRPRKIAYSVTRIVKSFYS